MLISKYYKDDGTVAEVHTNQIEPEKVYNYIVYKDKNGIIGKEVFQDKSIHYVEDAAENYALGIKEIDDADKR